jgi:hypothetical protein
MGAEPRVIWFRRQIQPTSTGLLMEKICLGAQDASVGSSILRCSIRQLKIPRVHENKFCYTCENPHEEAGKNTFTVMLFL